MHYLYLISNRTKNEYICLKCEIHLLPLKRSKFFKLGQVPGILKGSLTRARNTTILPSSMSDDHRKSRFTNLVELSLKAIQKRKTGERREKNETLAASTKSKIWRSLNYKSR